MARADAMEKVVATQSRHRLCAALSGLWIGLGFLKFGNPPLCADQIPVPGNRYELVFAAWPLAWGYWLMLAVLISTIGLWKWPAVGPRWVIALPGLWFAWQALSA